MLILILVAIGLYQIAKRKEMKNKALWPVLGVIAWFGGQFLAGVVLGLTDPRSHYDDGELMIYAFVGAAVCTGIVFIMQQVAINRQQNQQEHKMDEVMDDTFDDL